MQGLQDGSGNVISPKHPVGKKPIKIRVLLLDGHIENFVLSPRCPGQEFFDMVVHTLHLEDTDYFDLEYEDLMRNKCWLDHFKPIYKPVSQMLRKPVQFVFKVKFYTPHLNLLTNKLTRKLFAMQLKRDLIDGELNCGENTAALLAAFIVQSELGDQDEEDRKIISHLDKMRLSKCYSPAFVSKVMDLHRNLVGMSQSEADYRLLDAARKLEFYGLKLHPATGQAGMGPPLYLGVTNAGLFLYQEKTRINAFSWSKIRKLSFKRCKFLIKLHPSPDTHSRDLVEFTFDCRNSCKNFWKKCLEHHAFFRSRDAQGLAGRGGGGLGGGIWASFGSTATHPYASQPLLHVRTARNSKEGLETKGVQNNQNQTPVLLSRSSSLTSRRGQNIFSKGSSFRYFGRTQQQLSETPRDISTSSVSVDQSYKTVGRLGCGYNDTVTSNNSASSLQHSLIDIGLEKNDQQNSPIRGLARCRAGFGSSANATDFGHQCLPDHFQLLLLSTSIHRPFSARCRTASSPSMDQNSIVISERSSVVGAQLMEDCGCRVPRVFSVNALKAKNIFQSDISTENQVTTISTTQDTKENDEETSILHLAGIVRSTNIEVNVVDAPQKSISSGNNNGYVGEPIDEQNQDMDSSSGNQTNSGVFTKQLTTSEEEEEPSFDAFGVPQAVSCGRPLSTSSAGRNIPSISDDILSLHHHQDPYPIRMRTHSTICHRSDFHENHEDVDVNGILSCRYTDDEEDSLLQHPLSVCVSRAVSMSELYENESGNDDVFSTNLQYPICHLGTSEGSTSPEQYVSSESNEKIGIVQCTNEAPAQLITSPHTNESPSHTCDDIPSNTNLQHSDNSYSLAKADILLHFSRNQSHSIMGEGTTDRSQHLEDCFDDPSSLAPALSIGAISAISGVSCFDDEENEAEEEAEERNKQFKLHSPSLLQEVGSREISSKSGIVASRTQSLPRCPPLSSQLSSTHTTSCFSSKRRIRSQSRSKPFQSRRIPAVVYGSLQRLDSDYFLCGEDGDIGDGMAPLKPTTLMRSTTPTLRFLRKKLVPPYHDRTFHLAKELSMTERTYVKFLRLILTHRPHENLQPQLMDTLTPIYEEHASILQASFARLVAWEKAALTAAQARTDYQLAVAGTLKQKWKRREQTLAASKRMQQTRHNSNGASSQPSANKTANQHNVINNNSNNSGDASDSSSNSISGIPRSASRLQLPDSVILSRHRQASNLSTSCSSISSCSSQAIEETSPSFPLEFKYSVQPIADIPTPIELPAVETDLREATRALAGVSRIANVYRGLLNALPFYERLFTNLPLLLHDNVAYVSATDNSLDAEEENESEELSVPINCPSILSLLRCPMRRLRYYLSIFQRLATFYTDDHPDRVDCLLIISRLHEITAEFEVSYQAAEAIVLTAELCRDIRPSPRHHLLPNATEDQEEESRSFRLKYPRRKQVVDSSSLLDTLASFMDEPTSTSCLFVRVGFLEKFTKRGFQARMALLFTDRLIYCGRVSGSQPVQLKEHGVISLRNARLEPNISDRLEETTSTKTDTASQQRERHTFALITLSDDFDMESVTSLPTLPVGLEVSETGAICVTSSSRTPPKFRRLVFATLSKEQKIHWLADLTHAISACDSDSSGVDFIASRNEVGNESCDLMVHDRNNTDSIRKTPAQEEADILLNTDEDHLDGGLLGPRSHIHQTVLRCSCLLYVCWHRRLTVSMAAILNANKYELSGYLLRKFKSSCGWQKLWTVFTDFTLFFYKSAEDVTPLASLPLLGYRLESTKSSVGSPAVLGDLQLHKPDVLRLAYKSHVYYFRTDGPISFERWSNVLSSALHVISKD